MHGFLIFLYLVKSGGSSSDTFNAIFSSFSGFQQICLMNFMDGMWSGLVTDHMCKLLIHYAIEGDQDDKKKKVKIERKEGETLSGDPRLENTSRVVENMFRQLKSGSG